MPHEITNNTKYMAKQQRQAFKGKEILEKKASFSPKAYIQKHPHTRQVVDSVKTLIVQYINSKYSKGVTPVYSHWYVGISQSPDTDRTQGHKTSKKLTELTDFHKFWAYGLANARQVEQELCYGFELNQCQAIGKVTEQTRWVYVYNLAASPKRD